MASLSEAELADQAGSTPERVREFAAAGILRAGTDGSYRPPDIQRVRIAEALDGAGISPEQVGDLIARGRHSTDWADGLSPDPVPLTQFTIREAAPKLGMPERFVARLFVAWNLPAPEPDDRVRQDDLELLRSMVVVYQALDRDEDTAVSAARNFGDNLRRIAESQLSFFRGFVEQPMIDSGMPHHQVMDAAAALAQPMTDDADRAIKLLHHRHLEHYAVQDIVENTEMSLEQAGVAPRRPVAPPAIAFLDLAGYTSITEEMGDEHAAQLALKLADIVAEAAQRHTGRAVKFLGDGVMFHFPDPTCAVDCGLDLVEKRHRPACPPRG